MKVTRPDEKMLTAREVSAQFNIPVNTLRAWRHEKRGPTFVSLRDSGHRRGKVLYRLSDVTEFFDAYLVPTHATPSRVA